MYAVVLRAMTFFPGVRLVRGCYFCCAAIQARSAYFSLSTYLVEANLLQAGEDDDVVDDGVLRDDAYFDAVAHLAPS